MFYGVEFDRYRRRREFKINDKQGSNTSKILDCGRSFEKDSLEQKENLTSLLSVEHHTISEHE